MRCLGRTETDRKITNEPWSSKQSLTEQRSPLFGVKEIVCPKKEKREQKFIKKVLTRAGIVRDVAYTKNRQNSRSSNVPKLYREFRGPQASYPKSLPSFGKRSGQDLFC